MKKSLYIAWFVIAAFFGLTFALKNSQSVQINYYPDVSMSAPASIVALVILFVGMIVGYLVGLSAKRQIRQQLNTALKENRSLEKKILEQQGQPVKDAVY